MAVFKRSLLTLSVLVFTASLATASPLCTSLTTLADYAALAPGQLGGCTLGDKLFYDFNYQYSPGGNSNVAASAVTVTTLVTNGGLSYALTFTGNWTSSSTVTPGQTRTADITLTFSVLAPPALPITRTSLSMTGSVNFTPNGFFESPGSIRAAESFTGGASGSINPGIQITTTSPTTVSGSATFPGATVLNVSKDINLSSGGCIAVNCGGGAGATNYKVESVTLTSFTESFDEQTVPEPALFLTFGSGLLFLGLAGNRFLRSSRAAGISGSKEKNNKNNDSEDL